LADEFDPEALQREIEQKKAEAQAEVARKLAEIEEFKAKELERIATEAKEQKEKADVLIEQKQRELQQQMEAQLARFQRDAEDAMERDRDAARRRSAASAADEDAKIQLEQRLDRDRQTAEQKQKDEYDRLKAKLNRQKEEKMHAFEAKQRAEEADAQNRNLQIREAEEKRRKDVLQEELQQKKAALDSLVTEASKRFWRSGRIVRGRRLAAIPLVMKKLKLIYRARSRGINPAMIQQFQNVAQAVQQGGGDPSIANAMATMIITPPGASTGSIIAGGGVGGAGVAAFPSGQTFMAKLNDIERMLVQMKKKNIPDGQFNSSPPPYTDARERQLESKIVDGALVPLSLQRLSPPQFVLYRFGVYIIDLLCHALNEPTINLLVAQSLPAKSSSIYDDNAFKFSFDLEGSTRTIFIHVDRLDSVGELTLLLVHIFAHMRAREWSDSHPRFTEEFFASLRHVCAELFFARSRRGHLGLGSNAIANATANHDPLGVNGTPTSSLGTTTSSIGDGWGMGELRSLFGAVDELPFREDVVSEVLDLDIRRDGHDDFFSPDRLWSRLDGYKVFANSIDLRRRLRGMEDTITHSVARHGAAFRRQYASSYSGEEQQRIDERWERKMRGDGDAKRDHRQTVRAKLDEWAELCDRLHAQLFTIATQCNGLHELLQRTGDDGRVINSNQTPIPPAELAAKRLKLKRMRANRDALQSRIGELERKSAEVARAVGVDDPLASTHSTTTTAAIPSASSASTPSGSHRPSIGGIVPSSLTSSGNGNALLGIVGANATGSFRSTTSAR
jgi:chemotaxis protein histidine kinase CheA